MKRNFTVELQAASAVKSRCKSASLVPRSDGPKAQILKMMAHDEHEYVRRQALQALMHVGSPSVEELDVCNNAKQNGHSACPAPSLPAAEIEAFVVEEIKAIGRDPALVAATVSESRCLTNEGIKRLKAERAALERQRRADDAALRKLVPGGVQDDDVARLAELDERNSAAQRRIAEIGDEISQIVATEVSEAQVAVALGDFDALWTSLVPKEQTRVLSLLIERVDHDGESGNLAITFRPTGIQILANTVNESEVA